MHVTGQESADPPAVVFAVGVSAQVGSLALVAAAQATSNVFFKQVNQRVGVVSAVAHGVWGGAA